MTSRWPKVRLGDVLKRSRDTIEIEPQIEYREVTVKLWGKGIKLRRTILGAEISANKRFKAKTDQFIVSRIDARNGAFGLIPSELNGAVVTTDFPLFNIECDQILPTYLNWLSKTDYFVSMCQQASEGTTNRVRLQEDRFLNLELPFPSLEDQKRIVARIEDLASKAAEAQRLRRQSVDETETLIDSALNTVFGRADLKSFLTPIADADLLLNRESRNPALGAPDDRFLYVDISSIGQGPSVLNSARELLGREAPSRARRVIHTDDVIFSTVRPYLCAIAKIGDRLDGQICSTGFAVFSCGLSINPDFLLLMLCSPFFINQCMALSTGAHYPAINDKNLKKVFIVVPPLSEQERIATYLYDLQHKLDTLKQLQTESTAELDVLLPSVLDRAFKGEL